MSVSLGLGYSTCPNDTFMFHALVSGAVPCPETFTPWLADIEELNRRALGQGGAPPLPVTKVSAAVLGRVTGRYAVMSAGAALGRGCGPLVAAAQGGRGAVGPGVAVRDDGGDSRGSDHGEPAAGESSGPRI